MVSGMSEEGSHHVWWVTRLTKFVTSYRQKVPASVPVTVIMGQLLSLLGRHDMAIGEYREALKALPESPLIWLCLGDFCRLEWTGVKEWTDRSGETESGDDRVQRPRSKFRSRASHDHVDQIRSTEGQRPGGAL